VGKFSYSKLDLFDQCPMRYKLKYIDGYRTQEQTIALEVGSIAHKGKELWGSWLSENKIPDYDYIDYVLKNGIEVSRTLIVNGAEIETVVIEDLLGIEEIKNKYIEEYYKKCNKTGMNYKEKFNIYRQNFSNKLDDNWRVLDVEKDFKIKYKDEVIEGFIDRIDINQNKDLRVVDYKTSKDIYRDDKLTTPLQMFIYTLACEYLYNKLPIEHIYDFIFLDKIQQACTKGYYNRGLKKLDKLLGSIKECEEKSIYVPKPTPLCHWCEYSNNTCTVDKELNGMCQYYSLWTPENKTFSTNKKWNDFSNIISENNITPSKDKKEFIW